MKFYQNLQNGCKDFTKYKYRRVEKQLIRETKEHFQIRNWKQENKKSIEGNPKLLVEGNRESEIEK